MRRLTTHRFTSAGSPVVVALGLVALTAVVVVAERPDVAFEEGRLEAEATPSAGSAGSMVMLSARGIGQLSSVPPSPPPAGAPVELPSGALLDLGAPASDDETTGGLGGCQGDFGVLNEKMTVVGLDPPGGCVQDQTPKDGFVHFAGGSDADCKPLPREPGCYRYVVARYADGCDLDPLYSVLGKRALFSASGKFDKDGVYTKCNKAPLLMMRTLRYIGSNGDKCGQDTCASPRSGDESTAPQTPSLWACSLLAAAAVTSWSV